MHEVFEHTADFGLRIRAESLERLFEEAGIALFTSLCSTLGGVNPRAEFHFAVRAESVEDLLHDWLDELLFTFSTKHVLLSRFHVQALRDGELEAIAWGEPCDPARHPIESEIKAITYHGLKVERDGQGWLAEVIVDI